MIAQFLGESLFTSFVAVLLSGFLVWLLLSMFNSLSGKTFSIGTLFQSSTLLLLLAVALFTGLVGGSYPAFYLSGFRPIEVLKGKLNRSTGTVSLRSILVVVQFGPDA